MENSNSAEASVKSLFLGLAIGTILGILFAPERGEEVRKTIKNKIDKVVEDINNETGVISGNIEEIKDRAQEKVQDVKDKVQGAKNKVARKAAETAIEEAVN